MTTLDPRTTGHIRIGVLAKPRVRWGRKLLQINHPPPIVSMATSFDLAIPAAIYERAGPLVERMKNRSISRRQYRLLRAILVENALCTGQHDKTDLVLRVIDQRWRKCWRRYVTWWG